MVTPCFVNKCSPVCSSHIWYLCLQSMASGEGRNPPWPWRWVAVEQSVRAKRAALHSREGTLLSYVPSCSHLTRIAFRVDSVAQAPSCGIYPVGTVLSYLRDHVAAVIKRWLVVCCWINKIIVSDSFIFFLSGFASAWSLFTVRHTDQYISYPHVVFCCVWQPKTRRTHKSGAWAKINSWASINDSNLKVDVWHKPLWPSQGLQLNHG